MKLLKWQKAIETLIRSMPAMSGKSYLIAYLFACDEGAEKLLPKIKNEIAISKESK